MPNFKAKPHVVTGHRVRFEDIFHAQEDLDAPDWVLEALAEERLTQARAQSALAIEQNGTKVLVPSGQWLMQRVDESMFCLTAEQLTEDYDLV